MVELTDWARMEFKPAKSRSLVLRRGRQSGHHPNSPRETGKELGWYRVDLNDKQIVKEMLIQAETWMTSLEWPTWLRDTNVGCFSDLWPLLVYKVPISTVEGLERNTYLRRWLGVLRSFCSIGLYSKGSKLQLPVTSVVEEYKATKPQQAMMLRDSQDARVRQADIEVRTGRKCSASRALREAEDCLHHADIIGSVAQGRLGLGCSTRASWIMANPKERRGMVQRSARQRRKGDMSRL
ncbi:hypothetical protein N1851_012487 [Merluccius polli]|uniref:Uncharacterized protein n=1 Tax=Merluccius polli TaxID=89951 RepID=A0AA47P277_MERPO|nr:hypothetical protein N1851_012487 [Merluccius polli]